ncbi:MAG TPA: hypothetical protein VFP58_10620 [Candidatus Eisenbacteria bacterium]|nr:hypothetical protein [Candidatus Eisenbacteria bacterium]
MSPAATVTSRVARGARGLGPAVAFLLGVAGLVGDGRAATQGSPAKTPLSQTDTPYRGNRDGISYGAYGELRFGHDRQAGVSNPDWFSFGQAGGFVDVRFHPRVRLALKGAYDRGQDDFTLERAAIEYRTGGPLRFHAGVLPAPLGTTNLSHDAPACEFAERSLVATDLVGVPYSELGIGVAGRTESGTFAYELDVVTGYDDGVVMGGEGGTRVPSGRNNYGDQNGVPALAARVVWSPGGGSELGLAAQSGRYNRTEISGVTVDEARSAHLFVADAASSLAGFRLFSEAALALVDVPPGLEGLYAERQWGLSLEAGRTLLQPVRKGWKRSRLTASLRADAVDLDARAVGDSRARVTASLNFRHANRAVVRAGWYYEARHDRFDNRTPFAGLTLTAASYF